MNQIQRRRPLITPVTVTPKEAIELAKEQGVGMTMPTLLSWVEKYHLGYKVGGRWRIQTQKFIDYLNGEARNATTATRRGPGK